MRPAGAGPHLARRRRRQYPQHHRQPDRRHRSAGAHRHAAARSAHASLHPQSPRDVRPAAQVQHRLRRRRPRRGAGGHQRHRLRARAGRRRDGVPAGVYFRLGLGGITGHRDFAHDTGVLLEPEECMQSRAPWCASSSPHGDRTDRTKARLKYVLDRWGVPPFSRRVEKESSARRCARRSGAGAARGRRRTSTAISASILRSRPASIMSASLCRSAAHDRRARCADLPRSPNASAAARCG